jgi:hypothetical protein
MGFTAQIIAGLAASTSALAVAALAFGIAWWLARRQLRRRDAELFKAFNARFDRLDSAVDTMAVEVERLGEAERYAAKLLASKGEVVRPNAPLTEGRVSTPH